MPRKDVWTLPEDLFRSFLRIRGKDIWWHQNFLANRVRVAKGDKSEKAFFITILMNHPLVFYYVIWVYNRSERGQFYGVLNICQNKPVRMTLE